MLSIRSQKDFWAGLLYAGVGACAIVLARDYGMGTGSRMGPAYFPTVLGSLLLLIGAVSLIRSLFNPGEPIGAVAWKPAALVTGATILFGVLLRPAGLLVALAALILTSAAASVKFRLDWRSLAFILGPMMEEYLRRALLMSGGSPTVLVTRPISATLLAVSAAAMIVVLLPALRSGREQAFQKD